MTNPSKPLNLAQAQIISDILRNVPKDPQEYFRDINKILTAKDDAVALYPALVDELAAARKRIAELEAKHTKVSLAFNEDGSIDRGGDLVDLSLSWPVNGKIVPPKCIIPQAEDAKIIKELLQEMEYLREGRVVIVEEEMLCEWRATLKRYLAAIEGGQP